MKQSNASNPNPNPYVDVWYFPQADKFAYVRGKYIYPAATLSEAIKLRRTVNAAKCQYWQQKENTN